MPNECESVTESGSVAKDATASEASVNARGSDQLAKLIDWVEQQREEAFRLMMEADGRQDNLEVLMQVRVRDAFEQVLRKHEEITGVQPRDKA